MEHSQPIEQVEGQLSLFEVRQFLGRACLIIDNVVYPQFELGEDEQEETI